VIHISWTKIVDGISTVFGSVIHAHLAFTK
jgi:hypothetical protein